MGHYIFDIGGGFLDLQTGRRLFGIHGRDASDRRLSIERHLMDLNTAQHRQSPLWRQDFGYRILAQSRTRDMSKHQRDSSLPSMARASVNAFSLMS